jgi:hypothetical protein
LCPGAWTQHPTNGATQLPVSWQLVSFDCWKPSGCIVKAGVPMRDAIAVHFGTGRNILDRLCTRRVLCRIIARRTLRELVVRYTGMRSRRVLLVWSTCLSNPGKGLTSAAPDRDLHALPKHAVDLGPPIAWGQRAHSAQRALRCSEERREEKACVGNSTRRTKVTRSCQGCAERDAVLLAIRTLSQNNHARAAISLIDGRCRACTGVVKKAVPVKPELPQSE